MKDRTDVAGISLGGGVIVDVKAQLKAAERRAEETERERVKWVEAAYGYATEVGRWRGEKETVDAQLRAAEAVVEALPWEMLKQWFGTGHAPWWKALVVAKAEFDRLKGAVVKPAGVDGA